MSLLHTCYELAKNLLHSTSKQVRFCAKEYRIGDTSYSYAYGRKKICKGSAILVWPFFVTKELEKCRKRAAETSGFCRRLSEHEPHFSRTSQKRNALFRICGETTKTHEKRDFGRRRHRQDQNTKLKGQFWKPSIKGFVLENAEGKGKCRSIYALIFFLLFVQSAQIGDKHSQNK